MARIGFFRIVLNIRGEQAARNLPNGFFGSAERPNLADVLAGIQPGPRPDCRNVIFQLTEASEPAVYVAGLNGEAEIGRFAPGNIHVLARRIYEEIPDDQCEFPGAGRI